MHGNKSFAHQFGISQKNVAANPSLGIGLNPNLNIEDEYIENLLKQTHFLNMEIKLIKQKQKENKGMGIMGLLNKDQNPVVTHALTSNTKYTEMKSQLAQKVNSAEADYLRLDDQNFAVKSQRDYAEKLSLKQEQKNIEHKIYVQRTLGDSKEKLNEQQKKLKEQRDENKKTTDLHSKLFTEWEQLTNKTKTKELSKEISANLEKQNETLKEKHLAANLEYMNKFKSKVEQADKNFRADPAFTALVQQNTELKEKLNKTNKELFDVSYRAKQMEELKKLSIRNKDIEAELKKQATEEAERQKKKLGDKKADLALKIKDSKAALQSNDDIRLAKGKIARKDKEISDLKKKTELAENNYKRLRDEVAKLSSVLLEKKEKNGGVEKKLNELKVIQNAEGVKLRETELDFEKSQSDLGMLSGNLKDFRKRLEGLEEKIVYLTAKEEYLLKEIDMDQGIKNVKIEKLSSLMHSNSGLNQTISDLMTKWDQIIRFSREPPS